MHTCNSKHTSSIFKNRKTSSFSNLRNWISSEFVIKNIYNICVTVNIFVIKFLWNLRLKNMCYIIFAYVFGLKYSENDVSSVTLIFYNISVYRLGSSPMSRDYQRSTVYIYECVYINVYIKRYKCVYHTHRHVMKQWFVETYKVRHTHTSARVFF